MTDRYANSGIQTYKLNIKCHIFGLSEAPSTNEFNMLNEKFTT